jgi:hypothetical protein
MTSKSTENARITRLIEEHSILYVLVDYVLGLKWLVFFGVGRSFNAAL